ncbi:MAG: hypothetical protein DCC71_14550, partial [Proteobacteria bacterium]
RALARRGAGAEAFVALVAACVAAGQLVAYAGAVPALDRVQSPRPVAEAIARLAAPHERVGLYRAADLANAVAYYGARRVDAFRSDERLAAFAAGGGRVLVFERERLAEVQRVVPVAPHGDFAVGDETWTVAVVRRDPLRGVAERAEPAAP